MGGTGKTPHTEYIIRLLKDDYRIAVLSRGYKRKSSGFILANEQSTSHEIGDEPYQMKHKFPDILVAVDADVAKVSVSCWLFLKNSVRKSSFLTMPISTVTSSLHSPSS